MTVVIFFLWPQTTTIATQAPEPVNTEIHTPAEVVVVPAQTPIPTPVPIPAPRAPRYGFTSDEMYLMAVLLTGSKYKSGDGEFDFDFGLDKEYDQISLVLSVVMNRVRSDRYPNTVSKVIWQPGQFSPMPQWKEGLPEVSDISLKRVIEWCKAYDAYDPGVQTIPEDHLYFSGDGHKNYSR